MSSEQQHIAAPGKGLKAVEQEEEEKKQLVLDTIAQHCSRSDCDFDNLREFGKELQAGGKLSIKIISGGQTNYSYKVFLENDPDKALYAKLAFSYALWNPNRNMKYDLKRTENEYAMMVRFADLMGAKAPIATPYFLVDVPGDAKLFVTEWAKTDEQFANQWIDGEVDTRVVKKVAQAMALLNLQPVDPSFNDNIRPTLSSMRPVLQAKLASLMATSDEEADSAIKAMKDCGSECVADMLDAQHEELMETREVLCHNDCHQFNILVAPRKADPNSQLNKFDATGEFALCDWEMAVAGPAGRDAGSFQAWPIATALAHAAHGRRDVALDLFQCNIDFFDEYASVLVEKGAKDEGFLRKVFRQALGATAIFLLFVFYTLGLLMDHLPLHDLFEKDAKLARGAIGYVGFKCFAVAYGGEEPDLDLESLRAWYKNLVTSQIEELAAAVEGKRRESRRSSLLRSAERRVSDTQFLVEDLGSGHLSHSLSFNDGSAHAKYDL